jgi:hypothetical protein
MFTLNQGYCSIKHHNPPSSQRGEEKSKQSTATIRVKREHHPPIHTTHTSGKTLIQPGHGPHSLTWPVTTAIDGTASSQDMDSTASYQDLRLISNHYTFSVQHVLMTQNMNKKLNSPSHSSVPVVTLTIHLYPYTCLSVITMPGIPHSVSYHT